MTPATLRVGRALVLVAAGLSLTGCGASTAETASVYRYDRRDVLGHLRQHGYAADTIQVAWQNPAGTKVYFQEPMHVTADGTRTVWVVSESDRRPRRFVLPVGAVWLDGQDRPRFPPPYLAGAITIENLDRQTGYIFERTDGSVRVGHMDDPNGWLFEFETGPNGFAPNRILAVDGAVVLQQAYDDNAHPPYPNNLWVFRQAEGTRENWTKEERRLRASMTRADHVGRRLLCVRYGGMLSPFPPGYSVYDVGTGKATSLGRSFDATYEFFLAGDFLAVPRRLF